LSKSLTDTSKAPEAQIRSNIRRNSLAQNLITRQFAEEAKKRNSLTGRGSLLVRI
jgi:hypothetical protein